MVGGQISLVIKDVVEEQEDLAIWSRPKTNLRKNTLGKTDFNQIRKECSQQILPHNN